MAQYPVRLRRFRPLIPIAGLLAAMVAGRAASEEPTLGIADLLVEPGTRQVMTAAMMRTDLWMGLDRRLPLDSVVYALNNGARTFRVLRGDSLWAVDYTWVYPHSALPPRWYDARELIRVGDSLALSESTNVVVTFGTCRIGVRAHNFEEAKLEAERLRPPGMPPALAGRLNWKLDQARKVLSGKGGEAPGDTLRR